MLCVVDHFHHLRGKGRNRLYLILFSPTILPVLTSNSQPQRGACVRTWLDLWPEVVGSSSKMRIYSNGRSQIGRSWPRAVLCPRVYVENGTMPALRSARHPRHGGTVDVPLSWVPASPVRCRSSFTRGRMRCRISCTCSRQRAPRRRFFASSCSD